MPLYFSCLQEWTELLLALLMYVPTYILLNVIKYKLLVIMLKWQP